LIDGMRRRDLLLGVPAETAASLSAAPQSPASELPLAQLRDQYRRDLFDDFLPFMERYVIDHRYGGFLCNTDRDGTNLSKQKTAWQEGRGIWVYSFLYNNLAREPGYLEVARKSVEFILQSKPADPDGLWPKTGSCSTPRGRASGGTSRSPGTTSTAACSGTCSTSITTCGAWTKSSGPRKRC
jgi:hypothetical protein